MTCKKLFPNTRSHEECSAQVHLVELERPMSSVFEVFPKEAELFEQYTAWLWKINIECT